MMIVPDLAGLDNATAEANKTVAENVSELVADATEIVKMAKAFGKAGALLSMSNGTERTTQAKKEPVASLQDRQTCASGSAFYACANGFKGCCSVDPCNPGGECPDGQASSAASVATTAASVASSASAVSASDEQSSAAPTTASQTSTSAASSTQDTTSLLTASSTAGGITTATASATASGTKASPAPACPGANNTMYTDSSQVQYNIHCNADNSYSSSKTIRVSVGGYGECFSACSNSSTCAGFTYVGLDAGSCYLKQQMLSGDYLSKDGSNYISCSKVNATAVAPTVSPSSTSSVSGPKKGKAGAVAGGVIGGIAFLALLLLLIALLAKRRRKKIEERRATVTHVFHGPIEAKEMTSNSPSAGHARSGSTAHDAFAPFGGFYRGFSSAQADRLAEDDHEKVKKAGTLVPDRPPPSLPPGVRAEKAGEILSGTVYKRPSNPSTDAVAMLDGTPIQRPLSQSSGSRSPRFHEHIAEMEDTSRRPPPNSAGGERSPGTPDTDSPTLGRDSDISVRSNGPSFADEVRRRQHLMSWNTYDPRQAEHVGDDVEASATMVPRTPPTARSPEQVSPDLSITPRDSNFVVSPFGSLHRGRAAPR